MKPELKPCTTHSPKRLGYLDWVNYAEKMIAQGEKQTQCEKCGFWFFKSEL